MIHENELRIGNYIRWGNDEVLCVDELKQNTIGASGFEGGLNGFILSKGAHGIVITEDWLKRFGFKEVIDGVGNSTDNYPAFERNGICIIKASDCFKFWIDVDDFYYSYSWTVLTYVHQLQNLYFSLTGEELAVKETV